MSAKNFISVFQRLPLKRGTAFGAIIVAALVAFEAFNYSTTDFALHDLLGDLNFIGLRWSVILALAFCGIDFAGIARLFTPQASDEEPGETWYLFGAWLLAATMNATLTWWGVSIAVLHHETLGNAVVDRQTLLKLVPIFIATLVWLCRILLIGTFSIAGERLFSQGERRSQPLRKPVSNRLDSPARPAWRPRPASPQAAFRPSGKAIQAPVIEPTFEPGSARQEVDGGSRSLRSQPVRRSGFTPVSGPPEGKR